MTDGFLSIKSYDIDRLSRIYDTLLTQGSFWKWTGSIRLYLNILFTNPTPKRYPKSIKQTNRLFIEHRLVDDRI